MRILRGIVQSAVVVAVFAVGFGAGYVWHVPKPVTDSPQPQPQAEVSGVVRFRVAENEFRPAAGANVYVIRVRTELGLQWSKIIHRAKSGTFPLEKARQALALIVNDESIRARTDIDGGFRLRLLPGFYYAIASGRAGDFDAVWSSGVIEVPASGVVSLESPLATTSVR